MSIQLNKGEIEILKSFIRLKDIKLSNEVLNNDKLRNDFITLTQRMLVADIINEDIQSTEGRSRVDNYIKNLEDQATCLLTDGIATAIIMGYFQSFNSDRAIDTNSEFGYEGMDNFLSAIVNAKLAEFVTVDMTQSLIQSGLYVNIRSIEAEEYYKNNLYHKDIEMLNSVLMTNIDDGYNVDMLSAIRDYGDIVTGINSYMIDLLAVYEQLFEDGFGIHPYIGVLTGSGSFHEIDDTNTGVKIERCREILRKLAERATSHFDGKVKISSARQFDYDEIFTNSKESTVYFPFKMLEYALGRCSSLNMNKRVYLPHASSVDWGKYADSYVKDNLRSILERGYYKALERVLLQKGVISSSFVSGEFCAVVSDYQKFLYDNYAGNIVDLTEFMIVKLVNSMKCCYILTRYGYLAGTVANLSLRVTNSNAFNCFSGTDASTRELFNALVNRNENEVFLPPYNLSNARKSDYGINLSVTIYDYQYEINPALSKAEPLFGYVIARQNKRKGKKVDWNRILVGESMSGKELYAARTSDIKLQTFFTHNIYSGSRGGKGVMTMNILNSAVSVRKPLFYLDRKPDMAAMLYRLSGGRMFVVNGGLYNSEFDIYGDFAEGGKSLEGWDKTVAWLNANPRIRELFDTPSTSYYSVLGDLVYFRAVMFCLGLNVLRGKMKGSMDAERNQYLNGDDGIVIVVDELTGYQNNIMSLLSDINSTLVRKALSISDVDTLLNKKEELESTIDVKTQEMNEATKESQRMKKEAEIDKVRRDIAAMIDEQSVYASTFFKKIRDSYSTLKSAKVANFKNKEFSYSDIFVLGQDLEVPYFASSMPNVTGTISPVFFPLKSDKKDYYANCKNGCIIRSFIEEFGEQDWFLGRNPDYDYGDKPYNAQVRKVLDDDGNWEYVGKHTTNEIRNRDHSDYSSVLFKPYLVLNECYEENPESTHYDAKGNPIASEPKYQYVTQCRERVNANAGGKDLWSTVRVKHLTKDAKANYSPSNPEYGSLEPGVGFRGLVAETASTSGSLVDDKFIEDSLARSGEAADWVANKMGFANWRDLIFDLSPNGLFSFDDMINAVTNPNEYTMETRLPLYTKLNLLDGQSSDNYYEGSSDDKYNFDDYHAPENTDDTMSDSDLKVIADYVIGASGKKFVGEYYTQAVIFIVKQLRAWGW